MRAGQLNRTVEIKGYSITSDDFGQETKTFATKLKTFAKVEYIDSNEKEQNGRYEGKSLVKFSIRHTPITTKDIIVLDGDVYEIKSIKKLDSKNIYIKIIAVSDG